MKFNLYFFLSFLVIIQIVFINDKSFGQTTYFISSSLGNDSYNGTSPSTPWKSLTKLQSILPSAIPGDKFLFNRGDIWTQRAEVLTKYAGIVGLDLKDVHGSSNNYITFGAYGNGNNPTLHFTGTGAVFQLEGCTYTIFENLTLESIGAASNRPRDGFYATGSLNGGGHDIIIKNTVMKLLQEGARLQDGIYNVTFQNCYFANMFATDVTAGNGIFATTAGLIVKDCEFYNLGGYDNPNGDEPPTGNYGWSDSHSHAMYVDGISNFEISGNRSYLGETDGFLSLINAHDGIVKGNIGHGYGFSAMGIESRTDPVGTHKIENVIIENNIFYDGQRCMPIGLSGGDNYGEGYDNLIIRNNIIYNFSVVGIRFANAQPSVNNVNIINNTIVNCYEAITVSNNITLSNINIKNNIFYNDKSVTYNLIAVTNLNNLNNVHFDYNLYYGIGNDTYINGKISSLTQFQATYKSEEQHAVLGNPLFVDPNSNNYSLKTGSPAIHAGTSLGLEDILQNFNSSKPDIGAIQYETYIHPTSGLKIFLEGSYEDGVMITDLEAQKIIPLSQPYASAPWNYSGDEEVTSIPQNVVDWVLIELRKTADFSSIVFRQAAFVNSTGYIVDLSGNNISFNNITNGDYYVVVLHRNHLAVMSANPVPLTNGNISYDFTTGEDKAFGSNAMAEFGNGVFGLYGGDSDSNGIIDDADVNIVGNNLFNINYLLSDLDLNGKVNVIDYKLPKKNLGKKTYVTGIFAL